MTTTATTVRARAADVSVVVPIRNEAATLPAFLASLDQQDASPLELVLVDAGSTDSTPQILRQFAAVRPHVRIVCIEAAFPGRARNVGIRAARGAWIAMTDAGTIVNRRWLAELVAARTAADVDAVFGTYEPVLDTSFQKCIALCFLAQSREIEGKRFRGPSTASLLMKKDVWAELGGFPEHLRACEDLLFFRMLADRGYHTAYAPGAMVKWRVPATLGQVFRRFRAYSLHTLKAGLGADWHSAIARMYLAGAACVLLGAIVHWSFVTLPIVGLVLRAMQSVNDRRDVLGAAGPATMTTYVAICGLLVWIDLSALVGVFDYAQGRLADRPDPCEAG